MTRFLSAALLILASCVLLAQTSQPPAPGPAKAGQQQQRQPTSTQQQPATDPRGTQQSPIVVKVEPTTKTYEEAAKEKEKEDSESSAKWWTLVLAVSTGVVGLLQLVMIGIQAHIAARQNKIMEVQNAILASQSRAAEESAKAATVSAEAANINADILRLLNRPWLETENWRITHSLGEAVPDVTNGGITHAIKGLVVECDVVNNSHTPARIHWIETITTRHDQAPVTRTINANTVITPGGKYPIYACIHDFNEEQLQRYESTGLVMNIRGAIHYSDLFSKKRIPGAPNTEGPRIRRFGRSCFLHHQAAAFNIPIGVEGVGGNDDDWDQ